MSVFVPVYVYDSCTYLPSIYDVELHVVPGVR